MNHTAHLRVFPVDPQVHFHLRGGGRRSFQNPALQIHTQQHVLGHIALGYAGRRHPDPVRRSADADIAVIGSHILPGEHPPPDFQDGVPGLLIRTGIHHRCHLTFQTGCFL